MEWFIGISCSIIAGIIMLIVFPTNVRDVIIEKYKEKKNTLTFFVMADFGVQNTYNVKSKKSNFRIISDYKAGIANNIQVVVKDKRLHHIKMNFSSRKVKKSFDDKQKTSNLRKKALEKCKWEISLFQQALVLMLNDNSMVYQEPYTFEYSINNALEEILSYIINDRTKQRKDADSNNPSLFKTRLTSRTTGLLYRDMDVLVDETFFSKYVAKMIGEGDIFLIKSRDYSMDIYGLNIEDFIKIVSPPFYVQCAGYVSERENGKYIDYKKIYHIDNYLLNLRMWSAENEDRCKAIVEKIEEKILMKAASKNLNLKRNRGRKKAKNQNTPL